VLTVCYKELNKCKFHPYSYLLLLTPTYSSIYLLLLTLLPQVSTYSILTPTYFYLLSTYSYLLYTYSYLLYTYSYLPLLPQVSTYSYLPLHSSSEHFRCGVIPCTDISLVCML